ncbi:MAG: hypothetical protein JOZ25_08560 [Actinobacteria bacterium]|nr:hypothetical protein [Actinomycetota bacterium]
MVKHGVYELAAVFHEGAMEACRASDQDFDVEGLDACPASTALGRGTASVITGFGPPVDPLATDIHIYHGPQSEIYVFTPAGQSRPILQVARARVTGNTISEDPVYPNGWPPPNGKAAPTTIDVRYKPARAAYLTTPASCPAGGRWTSNAHLAYTDGSSDSVSSNARCIPSKRRHRHHRHHRRDHDGD